MPSSNSNKLRSTCSTIAFYLLFGSLHEASHLLCAHYYVLGTNADLGVGVSTLLQIILGRQVHIRTELLDNDAIAMIRHAGWITSCLVAMVVHALLSQRATSKNNIYFSDVATKNNQSVAWQTILILTAYATALEALVTDLFQFTPLTTNKTLSSNSMIFYCGNFGLIILNPMWLHHKNERGNCHSAMAILKDMIRTTMMRGAQSGGVVTFEPTSGNSEATMEATRSRVVNMKRTDLSERIIAQVQKDNRSAFRSRRPRVKTFSGHTRFATTSIANFDGTHPHRWSPRGMRNVCNMETGTSTCVGVENYIMHNGSYHSTGFAVMNNVGAVKRIIPRYLFLTRDLLVLSFFFQVTLSSSN